MANLKEVKSRISSVVATQQITKAMKMVAASKLRKAQNRIIQMRSFAKKFTEIFHNVSAVENENLDWYNEVRLKEKILIIAISSDRGLCGSFNANIIKAIIRRIQTDYKIQHDRENVTILPVGKKVYEYFSKRAYKIEGEYFNLLSHLSFESVSGIMTFIIDAFKSEKYDRIEVIYNEFKNVATQILNVEKFLPIITEYKDSRGTDVDYIYQPNRSKTITALVPKLLKVQLFKALLDSGAAENGARMTAMDKATENAGELLKELRLTYNRTRQEMITKEILEIVGGAEALKNT